MISVLSLTFEAFRLSLLVLVTRVPVIIRLVLEIHRWPRGLSAVVRASARRHYFTVLKVDWNAAPTLSFFSRLYWLYWWNL